MSESEYEARRAAHDAALMFSIASGRGDEFDSICDALTAEALDASGLVIRTPDRSADEPPTDAPDDFDYFGDLPF